MVATTAKEPETLRLRISPPQSEFRHSPALYRGFVGGRGAGKSWIGAYDLLRRCRPGRTYLVGSPTGVLMGDTTYPTLKAIAEQLGVWHGVKLTPYPNAQIRTQRGIATLRFRTAEDPDKMRGPNLSGVWLDEASLMHEDAYRVCIGALREAGEQGWLSATFTPKGRYHWTYETFGTNKPNTALVQASSYTNPFNPKGWAANLEAQYSPLWARQEVGGEFLEIEGAEWPSAWFPESHWFDAWPNKDEIVHRIITVDSSMGRQADVGDYSAIVGLTWTRDGRLWIEADLQRRPITQVISDGLDFMQRMGRETGGPVDGFGVESDVFQELVADEFDRQATTRGLLLPLYKIFTDGVNKVLRVRRLTPYLSGGKFRWRNTPGTQLLVRQLREFPVGEHDDGPDALEMALRLSIDLSYQR